MPLILPCPERAASCLGPLPFAMRGCGPLGPVPPADETVSSLLSEIGTMPVAPGLPGPQPGLLQAHPPAAPASLPQGHTLDPLAARTLALHGALHLSPRVQHAARTAPTLTLQLPHQGRHSPFCSLPSLPWLGSRVCLHHCAPQSRGGSWCRGRTPSQLAEVETALLLLCPQPWGLPPSPELGPHRPCEAVSFQGNFWAVSVFSQTAVLKGRVHIRDWREEGLRKEKRPKARQRLFSEAFKTRVCWFSVHHPDGCVLPADRCPFAHGPAELRPSQTPKTDKQAL